MKSTILLILLVLASGCAFYDASYNADTKQFALKAKRLGDQQVSAKAKVTDPKTGVVTELEIKQVSQAEALNTLAGSVKDLTDIVAKGALK